MPTTRGRAEVDALFASAPDKIERVLRGAGRAGGKIIAEEARMRATAEETRGDIRVRTRAADGRVVVTVDVKPGWGRTLGLWAEYGTDPHLISVADSQREGRTVRRINMLAKAEGGHALVIGGRFVGGTVMHPGARPHPFLRPALDTKERDALAAAQEYINARLSRAGINASGVEDGDA